MYILKNVIKSLLRNKVRNIFNMITMIIMISTVVISSIINSSTNTIVSKYKKKFESEVQIRINQEKLAESTYNGTYSKYKELTSDDYLRFADSRYVNKSFFTGNMYVHIDGLKDESNQYEEEKLKEHIKKDNTSPAKLYDESRSINARIIGYTNKYKGFRLPKTTIQKGNIFKNDNECIVTENFLKLNRFDIGDKITISSGYKNEKGKKLVLKIVGTYKKRDIETDQSIIVNEDTGINDEILTTYDTLVKYEKSLNLDTQLVYTNAEFLLNSYKDRDKFEKELRKKGLSDIYKLTIDEREYRQAVEPVKHLSNISFISMFVILIVGSFILFIISISSVNNIKYNIGVLRVFGISKLKIIISFLYESIIMTIICVLLGMGVGIVLSQPVSNYVFEYQKVIDKSIELDNKAISSDTNNDLNQEIKTINAKQSKDYIFKSTIVGILLILLTSIVGIYNSITYKAIEIINDRN